MKLLCYAISGGDGSLRDAVALHLEAVAEMGQGRQRRRQSFLMQLEVAVFGLAASASPHTSQSLPKPPTQAGLPPDRGQCAFGHFVASP